MRIVFMGTPDFAVPSLEALIGAGHDVAMVVTRPDKPRGRGQKPSPCAVKQAALRHGLPVEHPVKLDAGFAAQLKEQNIECGIIVAYGRILPPVLLEALPYGWINVHASLLPAYRGPAPIHRAVMAGETMTGITTMVVAPGLDEGDMLLQQELPIGPQDTTGDIHDRLAEIGGVLLAQTVAQLAEGTLQRRPQDHSRATYAPLLTRDDERVDWSWTTEQIHNRVRGMNPWPGAYMMDEDRIVKITAGRSGRKIRQDMVTPAGGTILKIEGEEAAVTTGDGLYWLTEVQPAGSKRMSAAAYLRGRRIGQGHRFT
ncbi:methionyl-tRNA formyltransferase [Heliophilum fasciatum]|uniref:Methionyl-tRNA formyltransferase n=1 Tax=Heliophilum fasciatum TaxID=35700 RepID=A0A4R2RZ63_9FIRM|nr:methionyl-tRNA formyltransferase [Heliophilum fasciatum]MCW2277208.1 methionyl-tRNA formyltransferase [Heliophilum fasciatum]TCP68157.1 methionyl-tRNA formyltransferase [Heliophilum fasciatum]